jgi:hypothetical protein
MIARVGEIIMNFEIITGASTTWSRAWPRHFKLVDASASFLLNFMTVCLDNRGTGKTDAPTNHTALR